MSAFMYLTCLSSHSQLPSTVRSTRASRGELKAVRDVLFSGEVFVNITNVSLRTQVLRSHESLSAIKKLELTMNT